MRNNIRTARDETIIIAAVQQQNRPSYCVRRQLLRQANQRLYADVLSAVYACGNRDGLSQLIAADQRGRNRHACSWHIEHILFLRISFVAHAFLIFLFAYLSLFILCILQEFVPLRKPPRGIKFSGC